MTEEDGDSVPIFHWKSCPSYSKSDTMLKGSIHRLIYTARRAALFRIATISQWDVFTNAQKKAFMEKHDVEYVPLFQQVPATAIQIVTNSIQNIFLFMDVFIEKVFEFFEAPKVNENAQNRGAQYNGDFFATLTFPALFFYFQTDEFSELGAVFLKMAIKSKRNKFLMSLLAAYFDNAPRFLLLLIDRFLELAWSGRVSILLAFKDALSLSFRVLTVHHRDVIAQMAEVDVPFLCQFLFLNYFPPRMRTVFGTSEEDDPEGIGKQLSQLFDYCAFQPESPHVKLMVAAMLDCKEYQSHFISYRYDFDVPTVHMVISGLETKMLFDLFLHAGWIKQHTKITSLLIPPDKANSILPGHVQFSHRKFLIERPRENLPVLFPDVVAMEDEMRNEDMSRSYAQLKKMALEEGQPLLDVLDNPKSMRVKEQLSSLSVTKSPVFRQYVNTKIEKKTRKSQLEFEKFVGRMATRNELQEIERDFAQSAQLYIKTSARDFMEKKCIPNGYVVPENLVMKPMPGMDFLEQKYAIMRKKPEESIVYRQKNTLTSTTLEPMLRVVNPDEVLPVFAIEFMLSIISEWKEESHELIVAIQRFLAARRSEQFLASAFDGYRHNKFVQRAVELFRRMGHLRIGFFFNQMTKLLEEFDEVNHTYHDGSLDIFASTIVDVIVMSSAEKAILCLLWFSRLSLACPRHINLLGARTQLLWGAASGYMWDSIRQRDGELISLIDHSIHTIPALD